MGFMPFPFLFTNLNILAGKRSYFQFKLQGFKDLGLDADVVGATPCGCSFAGQARGPAPTNP
jgi:hypothetical protein